jgi:hypothetical protein
MAQRLAGPEPAADRQDLIEPPAPAAEIDAGYIIFLFQPAISVC